MQLALALLLASLAPVASLSPAPADSVRPSQGERAARSIYQVHTVLDATLIAGGTVAAAIPYLFAKQLIHPRCPCDPREVNSFDRGTIGDASVFADDLSDVTVLAAIAAPPVLDALDVGFGGVLLEDSVVYAETMAIDAAFVSVTKAIVQRPLPRVYAGQGASIINTPNGYRSFYSGHTTATVAALSAGAMLYTLRHGDSTFQRTWPWVVTALIGTSVAVERVLAGRHFISDTIVGAATGAAVGVLVPLAHERAATAADGVSFGVIPSGDGAALSFALRL